MNETEEKLLLVLESIRQLARETENAAKMDRWSDPTNYIALLGEADGLHDAVNIIRREMGI